MMIKYQDDKSKICDNNHISKQCSPLSYSKLFGSPAFQWVYLSLSKLIVDCTISDEKDDNNDEDNDE